MASDHDALRLDATGLVMAMAAALEDGSLVMPDCYMRGQVLAIGGALNRNNPPVDPYDRAVIVQGHRHSEPVCAWPDCQTYLTREQMADLPDVGTPYPSGSG